MIARRSKSGFCVASFVLGLLGLPTLGLTAIPAIICGHIGRSRARQADGALEGDGLALAGLIMGYVSIALALVLIPFGGLTVGAFKYAQAQAQRNRTVAVHAVIRVALEQYKEKFGEYPTPAKDGTLLKIDGQEYDVGGALMLYQTGTGDGDDMIRTSIPTRSSSDGEISEEEKKNAAAVPIPKTAVLKTNVGYLLVDGFGHPFQFTVGGAESVNPTYDLWSFGTAKPAAQTGKAKKRDDAATTAWIKNW